LNKLAASIAFLLLQNQSELHDFGVPQKWQHHFF